ncbi:hypothetical protein C2U70_24895 [Bradyrhizobium guangdongense]|nr:hypothetical protein C2U70_24895 [Bradyrhizobium guangdongense]
MFFLPTSFLLRLSPLAERGRIASLDAIRVRGSLRESNSHRPRGDSPSPQPSPRKRGEGEVLRTANSRSACDGRACG